MTALVVTGTRHGRPDVAYWLNRWLNRHGRPVRVIVGDALGVDLQAYDWAVARGIDFLVFKADWSALGKRAGPVRNQAMVDAAEPGDWLLAFPSGESRGTRDCMRRGVERGLRVYEMPLREVGAVTSPESIRTALFAWANATGCELLSWRFVGVCVEARFEVDRDVELRVLAPTVGEVVEQLDRELAEYRKPRLRLVRGGRS